MGYNNAPINISQTQKIFSAHKLLGSTWSNKKAQQGKSSGFGNCDFMFDLVGGWKFRLSQTSLHRKFTISLHRHFKAFEKVADSRLGLDKLPQSLNHGRRHEASLKAPLPMFPGINLFICYHIRVQLHFPGFARIRHAVLCNGSSRGPDGQTAILGDQLTSLPASLMFLLLVDLLFSECGVHCPLSPHLRQSLL